MRAKAKTETAESEHPSGGAVHITKGSALEDLGFSPDEALDLKIEVDIWRALLAHIEEQQFGTEYLVRVTV